MLADLLRGAVWLPWTQPGLVRLIGWMGLNETEWKLRLEALDRAPGCIYKEGRSPQESGWLIPQNVVKAGRRGAVLADYPIPQNPAYMTTPAGFTLRPHQGRALSFVGACEPEDEGCVVGGKAGAGKTIIALQSVFTETGCPKHAGAWPKVLIIGTKRARSAWVGPTADPAKHYGLSVEPLESETFDREKLDRHRIAFIHYDILDAWQSALFHIFKPEYLIFDELHHLCHPSAKRSEAARFVSACASVKKRIGLTGSPIPNRRSDLYHALAVIQPNQWGKKDDKFLQAYCGRQWVISETNKEYPEADESRVTDEQITDLRSRLAWVLLRFGEAEVQGLPDLEISREEITLDDSDLAKEIRLAHRDFGKYLRQRGELPNESVTFKIGGQELTLTKKDQLGKGWRLRAMGVIIGLLSRYKAKRALELAQEISQRESHVAVFTWRVPPAKALFKGLTDVSGETQVFGPLDGDMEQDDRQKEALAFARSPRGICVATIGGAGESVNELAAASHGIAVDLHYQPHALGQMVSRLHRDGGPHSKVYFTFIICKGTLDEELLAQFEQKVEAQKRTVPGESVGFSLVNINEDPLEAPSLDTIWAMLEAIPDEE